MAAMPRCAYWPSEATLSGAENSASNAWDAVAATDPYLGSLGNPRYAGLRLSRADRAHFFDSGAGDVAHVLALMRAHYAPPARFAHALDFGCGAGRWLRAMEPHCERLTGVDVSRAMLRTARRNTRAELSPDIPDGAYDWINSFLTFPHILPARGLELLDRLLSVAAPDAVLSVHIGLSVPSPRPEASGPSALFASDLPAWLARLGGAGFSTVVTEYLDFGHYQGARLVTARGAYREAAG